MNDAFVQLQKLVVLNRLPHAFILSGKNINLAEAGLAFAKWALCAKFANTSACGDCRVCQLLQADTSPDFMQIIPVVSGNSKAIKIEQIRELIQFVQVKPQFSTTKIVLLCEVEYLNIQAASALLRTLEEPPSAVHIILTTATPQILLETIISRCPIFNIEPITKEGEIVANQLLFDNIVLDLSRCLVLQEIDTISIIEKWQQQEASELLNCLWFVVASIINYKFKINCDVPNLTQEKIMNISQTKSLQQLWPILDMVQEVKKNLLLGRQVNIQMFLEKMMLCWAQDINNASI